MILPARCTLAVLLTTSALAAAIGRFDCQRETRRLVLATGSVARYVIVIAPDAPSPVVFAAGELKEHLDRVTGGDFRIVRQMPTDGRALVLGATEFTEQAGIQFGDLARDGYVIRTAGETVFILGRDDATGKSRVLLDLKTKPFPRTAGRYAMERALGAATWDFERGTLYGVYRFLEEVGVRWFFPGPLGTVVPHQPDLQVQAFSLREEPWYRLRKVGRETWQWYMLDVAASPEMINREEYEELGWGGDALRLWLLRMRGSSEWLAFNHRPPRMELEQRYGKQHPEYFALRENGQRDLAPQPGRTGHLCYTEPGVFEITQRDIDAYYAGKTAKEMGLSAHCQALNPFNRGWPASAIYGDTVSLLPHDSFRACQCRRCAPLVHEERGPEAKYGELVWTFVDKVSRWMQTAHPGKRVTCLAYSYYTEKPPALHHLPDNVLIGLCAANYARTHNCVAEENYRDFMRLVRTWDSVNDQPLLIWMHHLYRHRAPRRKGVPMLLTGFFQRLFRDLAPHARWMHIELDADSLMLEQLNRYVVMHLLYNPNLDAGALVEDYARRCYGPGGEVALDILRDVEQRSMGVARTFANTVDTWEKHFTAETVAGYRARTDEMLRLTRGTAHARAAELFSKWFVGEIERGRAAYVKHVKRVAGSPQANVSIRALVGTVTIDGKLDEESWKRSSVRTMITNIDGKPTRYRTEVRFLRAHEALYFGFHCEDPNTADLPIGPGEADSVEIFLDPQHDHDSYVWLQIDLGGRTLDWRFPGGGAPVDQEWESGAQVAVAKHDGYWTVEVRLPRDRIPHGKPDPVGRPWGANFGRSMKHPPQPKDQFSCWSPLLRGKFHQPELFGHIFFVK